MHAAAAAEPAATEPATADAATAEPHRRRVLRRMMDQKMPIPSVHRTAPPIAVGTADADGTESEASSGNR